MGDKKTVFRLFSIFQYRNEEEFLSNMHLKGWRYTHMTIPGFYHFEKCEPGQFTYRLDYNREGIENKDEYVRLFSDCGWEYLGDVYGYSYFRKEGQAGEDKEEIFCDDASRLEMMKRVFNGRVVPLILVFALVVVPQMVLNISGNDGKDFFREVMSLIFCGLAVVYLVIFLLTAVQLYNYEKAVNGESKGFKIKYTVIFCGIALLFMGMGAFLWNRYHSDHELTENETGYMIEADSLNASVVREYKLKSGDVVDIKISGYEKGHIYAKISKEGETPVFTGDLYGNDTYTIGINDDGIYRITVSGNRVKGKIEVAIR